MEGACSVVADRPHRRTDILSEAQPDGSAVLYDPRTRVAYAVSATALQVWLACDGTQSAAAIADQLGAVYDAPPDRIRRDVDDLLADFNIRGLLRAVPEHPA